MPDDTPVSTIWITKVDVASRQIVGSVRLFFERRDPIVTHTVVAASHQVLTDLGVKSGVKSIIKGDASKEHLKIVNFAANFLKHADKDPEAQINIAPLNLWTAELLMDCVWMLQMLAADLPMEAKVYWAWFVSTHAELFSDAPDQPQFDEFGLDPNDFEGIITLLTLHELFPELANDGSVDSGDS